MNYLASWCLLSPQVWVGKVEFPVTNNIAIDKVFLYTSHCIVTLHTGEQPKGVLVCVTLSFTFKFSNNFTAEAGIIIYYKIAQ